MSFGTRPAEVNHFFRFLLSLNLSPSLSKPLLTILAKVFTPGVCERPRTVPPTTGKIVSKAPASAVPSAPTRSLFRKRRAASSLPNNPTSSSVFRSSGRASKPSEMVACPSVATKKSAAPAATLVVAACLGRLPNKVLPVLLSPSLSAARPNRLFDSRTLPP